MGRKTHKDDDNDAEDWVNARQPPKNAWSEQEIASLTLGKVLDKP